MRFVFWFLFFIVHNSPFFLWVLRVRVGVLITYRRFFHLLVLSVCFVVLSIEGRE